MTTDGRVCVECDRPDPVQAWTGLAYGRKRWLLYPPTMNPPTGASGSAHNCANAVPSLPITTWLSQVC